MTESASPIGAGAPATDSLRSALFVPATRLDRMRKALDSGADTVIIDLEDAVEPGAKAAARDALTAFLDTHAGPPVWVRVNDASTPWHQADLQACRGRPAIAAIMLPKADDPAPIGPVADACGDVVAVIESARGLANAARVASAPGVSRLAFGSLDYGLDMHLTVDTPAADSVLDYARCQILLHARIAGLPAPLDGVFPSFQDLPGLKRAARRARDMGFGGMLCIHPAQIAPVHAAFAPSADQIEWARRVLQARQDNGGGAFKVDGKMVDAPVIGLALQILARIGEAAP